MIEITAKQAWKGRFIQSEITDSVDFGDELCKFDFNNKKVLAISSSDSREIGEIVSFKSKSIRPFLGIAKVGQYQIETQASFFEGLFGVLRITVQGEGLESHIVVGHDDQNESIGDLLKWKSDWRNKQVEIQCQEACRDFSYVLGSIILKAKQRNVSAG